MPDWVENCITITRIYPHSLEYFKDTLNFLNGRWQFNFSQTVPRPQNVGNPLNWNRENWGTKWDLNEDNFQINISDDEIVIYCDTAWTPPTFWADTVAKKFGVEIIIEYESSPHFQGISKSTPEDFYDEFWGIGEEPVPEYNFEIGEQFPIMDDFPIMQQS